VPVEGMYRKPVRVLLEKYGFLAKA